MPADRFYIKSAIIQGQSIKIEGTEFHHLVHVMRASIGDSIEIVNGCNVLAEGTIRAIEKKYASVLINKAIEKPPSSFQIILAQAMPRFNRLDFILEKGTELGMTQFWLFPGACSERKTISDNQRERMELVMVAAMKQSGRLDLPFLEAREGLKKWDAPLPYAAFYGDVSPSAPSFEKCWKEKPPREGAIIFIGPESGFNEQEIKSMQKLGVMGVKLHHNILRTDTAAAAALTLMSHWALF